jgi:hypothetical protein
MLGFGEQVNDNLMKTLEECAKTKTNDMMRFDSPPRASRTAGLSDGMAELRLDEGGRASGSLPRPMPSPRSTLTTMDDGMLQEMPCDSECSRN